MAKSIDLAPEASRLASLLLSYVGCAFVAPRDPGASTAIFVRLSHSRALTRGSAEVQPADSWGCCPAIVPAAIGKLGPRR